MEPIKTKGIVIRTTEVGDYNKMLTVLSPDMGKISVWAKGVKSPKNPMSAGANLLCYSEMILTHKGDAYTLTGCNILESFYGLRDDIAKLAACIYMADVAASVCDEGIQAHESVRLLLNAIHFIEKGKKSIPEIKAMFELRQMACVGYMPEIEECMACGADGVYFDIEEGGILCSECKTENSVKISKKALEIIRLYFSPELKDAFYANAEDVLPEISKISEKYIEVHTGRHFKTLDYLKSVM